MINFDVVFIIQWVDCPNPSRVLTQLLERLQQKTSGRFDLLFDSRNDFEMHQRAVSLERARRNANGCTVKHHVGHAHLNVVHHQEVDAFAGQRVSDLFQR